MIQGATLASFYLLNTLALAASPDLNALANLNDLLRQGREAATPCAWEDFPFSQGSYCSASNSCRESLLLNRNALYSYENADGRAIPNVPYLAALESGFACAKAAAGKTAHGPAESLAAEVQANFFKLLKASGERDLYEKVAAGFSKAKSSWFSWMKKGEDIAPTPADLEARIASAEKSAGITLSRPIKDAWLKILAARVHGPRQDLFSESVRDPFLNTQMLFDSRLTAESEIEKNQNLYRKRAARTREIFAEAKAAVLEKLKARGIATEALRARLGKVKLKLPEAFPDEESCGELNAYYDPSHTVNICAPFLNMPEAALFQTIAHELTHSIDPCFASHAIYHFQIKGDAKGLLQHRDRRNQEEKGRREALARLGVKPFGSPQDSNDGFVLGENENSAALYLTMNRADFKNLEEGDLTLEKLFDGVPFAQHPLKSVMECLAKDSSTGARLFNSKAKPSDTDFQKFCGEEGGDSQISEALADWMAGEVIAHKLAAMPFSDKKRAWAFEASAFLSVVGCAELAGSEGSWEAQLKKAMKSIPGAECNWKPLALDKDSPAERHPGSLRRIDSTILNQPSVQAALGCAPFPGREVCR